MQQEFEIDKRKQLSATIVLLLNTGLMWFGFFMLIPLVALHATRDLAMSAALAGLVLAVRQFVQQGLGIFIAATSDSIGYRRMMLMGVLIRAFGFAYLAIAADALNLMLAGIVAGIGGACFEASSKAALTIVSRGYKHDTVFSLAATVSNIGMTSGPLLGVILLQYDFEVVGLAAAGVYVFCYFLLLIFVPHLPPVTKNSSRGPAQVLAQLGTVWQNRPFVLICLLLAGYYVLYVQINISLPLFVNKLTGSDSNVALLYAINSGLAIALQYIAVKFLRRWFGPVTIIGIGTGLAGLGLTCMAFAHDLSFLIGCIVIYSLGRLLVEPMAYSVTLHYATRDTMASYFGFTSLSLAVGGVVGNLAGGWLFDLGNHSGLPGLVWFAMGDTGLIVVAGVLWWGGYLVRSAKSSQQLKMPQIKVDNKTEQIAANS